MTGLRIPEQFAKNLLEMGEITEADYKVLTAGRSKFNSKITYVDDIKFHSAHEANRYSQLKIRLMAGEISDLKLQVPFSFVVDNVHVCDYIADFTYYEQPSQEPIVEDAKGVKTAVYQIKKKLMLACYGIKIRET